VEFVASLSQGRTADAQCGLFTHKSVPVIFEPPCIKDLYLLFSIPDSTFQYYFSITSTLYNMAILNRDFIFVQIYGNSFL